MVAVKDISSGDIRPGKVLGKFRTREFAERDHSTLAIRANKQKWQVGIFQNGKCLI